MLKSLSKPMQFMLVAGLALIAYLALQPVLFPTAPAPTVAKLPVNKMKSAAKDIFLPVDYSVAFAPNASATVKNCFVPIIKAVPSASKGVSQVNIVPPEFAGGEPNWSYTGSAEIDGVMQALLENKTSGDNVYLKVGDSWKGIYVEEITDDSLVLQSPDMGIEKKLELPTEVVTGPGSTMPVMPNLRGNIGQMSLQPDPSVAQIDPGTGLPYAGAVQNDPTGGYGVGGYTGGGNGGGGRSRGGRNRGRGGSRGGGGGG